MPAPTPPPSTPALWASAPGSPGCAHRQGLAPARRMRGRPAGVAACLCPAARAPSPAAWPPIPLAPGWPGLQYSTPVGADFNSIKSLTAPGPTYTVSARWAQPWNRDEMGLSVHGAPGPLLQAPAARRSHTLRAACPLPCICRP